MGDFRFDATEAGFSLVNAFACARLASLVYQDEAACRRETATWGLDRFEALERGANFGFVCGNRDARFVVFRGTDDRADWKTNLRVGPAAHAWGSVHGGFLSAAQSFWPDLPECLRRMGEAAAPVWVTGHSLGGALALLAGVDLFLQGDVPIGGIYTFGQPQVGNAWFRIRFKEKFPRRCFRFVNHIDKVAGVGGFSAGHVGEERYIDVDGKLWNGRPFLRALLDAILGEWRHGRARSEAGDARRRLSLLAGVEAHGMGHYCSRIEAALASTEAGR